MSMKNSGCGGATARRPRRRRSPGALVEVSTTSTSPSFDASSSQASGVGAEARRRARPRPRAAVGDVRDRRRRGPRGCRPRARRSGRRRSSSTRRPARSPKTCSASAAAAAGTDAGLSPIAVSVRTRLPSCSACRKTRSSSGPTRRGLVGRLDLAEDLALAGHQRVEPGRHAEEVHGRRLVVHAVGDAAERLAGELLERRERARRRRSPAR